MDAARGLHDRSRWGALSRPISCTREPRKGHPPLGESEARLDAEDVAERHIRAVAVVENGPGGSLQRGSSTSARAVSGRLTVGGSARPSRNDYFSMRGTKRTEELARHEG